MIEINLINSDPVSPIDRIQYLVEYYNTNFEHKPNNEETRLNMECIIEEIRYLMREYNIVLENPLSLYLNHYE